MFLQRLTELINNHGLTRNKFLTSVGLNPNSFVVWEKRGTVPGGNTLSIIADYFHVSTDYLLGRTDDPSPAGEAEEPSPLRSALLGNFNQLNQEGQEKLTDYSDDLVASGKYIKTDPDQLGKEKDA